MCDRQLRASVCLAFQYYLVANIRNDFRRAVIVKGVFIIIYGIISFFDVLKRACHSLLYFAFKTNNWIVRLDVNILDYCYDPAQNIQGISRVRMRNTNSAASSGFGSHNTFVSVSFYPDRRLSRVRI